MLKSIAFDAVYVTAEPVGKIYRGRNNLKTFYKDFKGGFITNYWNATFIGAAAEKIKFQRENSKIKITNFSYKKTPYTNKEGDKATWEELSIFDYEPNKPDDVLPEPKTVMNAEDDEDLPF